MYSGTFIQIHVPFCFLFYQGCPSQKVKSQKPAWERRGPSFFSIFFTHLQKFRYLLANLHVRLLACILNHIAYSYYSHYTKNEVFH